ncbi:hypothetical protein Y032_0016g3103 [Ancylostoma ceylanicum]|uniref:Uncharacterized protein n=1 Tax=Ancylostoma ceylanicum TaxID=53326 RepID=A0A016V5Z7_9BILA|nr:hypothetical protein Y032_0016g3103 [Ancylostoma ceylanicum]
MKPKGRRTYSNVELPNNLKFTIDRFADPLTVFVVCRSPIQSANEKCISIFVGIRPMGIDMHLLLSGQIELRCTSNTDSDTILLCRVPGRNGS